MTMTNTTKTYIYFIDNESDKVISKRLLSAIPNVGNTTRFSVGEKGISFYRVIEVCFVYDEPDCPYERVNVGLEFIVDGLND